MAAIRVSPDRIRTENDAPVVEKGEYVLCWLAGSRRVRHNPAVQRAVVLAEGLGKPLLVFEGLRVGYRWASDRFHTFVLEGMADNARRCETAGVRYYPWVEREAGQGKGLLAALGKQACAVVTDDYPAFFLPRARRAAAEQVDCRFEAIDANGLLPMRVADKTFARAHDFRRFLQKQLGPFLESDAFPVADPLDAHEASGRAEIPPAVLEKWPAATPTELEDPDFVASLPIDHSVKAVAALRGGTTAAEAAWAAFESEGLARYADGRNHPDDGGSSGLSPWLHFGHTSPFHVFERIVAREKWTPDALGKPTGKREGWWGMSAAAEAFLDELVTWREVGFNMAHRDPEYDAFHRLPGWAKITLSEHGDDPRPTTYTLEQLERAQTHDEIWNAAQRQLVAEGRMHNYLRMLWGKKVLEWSATPREAAERLIELNNKYAIDGRDPSSYSGIYWIFGRYDRAWGPERPIYGKVRYMTSDSTRKKLRMSRYLDRWGPTAALL